MPSNNPYSFDDLVSKFAGKSHTVPLPVRPNTVVQWDEDEEHFDVFLYGSRIATLFSDGKVRVNTCGRKTNTTRNRIDDVLLPLGWRIKIVQGKWYLKTVRHPQRFMEFHDDMILAELTNDPKEV